MSKLFSKVGHMVFSRLEKANIMVTKEPQKVDVENPHVVFASEMEERHFFTVLNFYSNLFAPLMALVPKSVPERYPNEYDIIFVMILGMEKGMAVVLQKSDSAMYETPKHYRAIKGMFTLDEIGQIKKASEELAVRVVEEIENCRTDFYRDRSKEDRAVSSMVAALQSIHKDTSLANGQKVLSELHKSGDMDTLLGIHFQNRGAEVFGTPSERLVRCLEELFIYWEVLSSTGHVLTSKVPLHPEWRKVPTELWDVRS